MIALLTILVTEQNHSVLKKERLVDYIVCLPWNTNYNLAKRLVDMIRETPGIYTI